jgi:hypothetical protein
MIALFLSSLISLILFVSFGFFIEKSFKTQFSIVEKLLVGLVFCNTITTCISIFYPINTSILLFLFVIGLIYIAIIKSDLNRYIGLFNENKFIVLCSFSIIIISFIITLNSPRNYDTGLYHLQAIKWIEEYSIVPGLANLHGRFGFNPNIFTLFALTSLKDWFHQEVFSINFTIFSIISFYFLNQSFKLLTKHGINCLYLFYIFLFLVILKLPNLSSPSPDFSFTAILLFIFARMIELSNQKNNNLLNYIPILFLGVYSLTIKLAAFPILVLLIFILFINKNELRKLLWILPLFGLIIFPWLIRNIILTGWLIYPFPAIDLFSFDWKVPLEKVIAEKNSITGWARNPGIKNGYVINLDFIDWFPIWWQRQRAIFKAFFILSFFSPLIVFIGQLFKKIKFDLFTNAVLITSFLGLIFWMFLAPDWRFGEAFIIISSIAPLLLINSNLKLTLNPKFIYVLLLFLLITFYTMGIGFLGLIAIPPIVFVSTLRNKIYQYKIIFGLMVFVFLTNYIKLERSQIKKIYTKEFYSNNYLVPSKIVVPSNISFKTFKISGLDIYLPSDGDRCYDHQIPCTNNYKDTTIELRNNSLQSGFRNNK